MKTMFRSLEVHNKRTDCTILRVHIEHNHVRRDGLHKRLAEEYHDVTENLRKAKKSVKSLVVKPISST